MHNEIMPSKNYYIEQNEGFQNIKIKYKQQLQKNIMIGAGKKKSCQIQFEKQNYLRHLHRLIKLKDGVSPQQIKRSEQQRKLAETINRVKKNHEYSRQYRWKQMRLIEDSQKDKDFSKVKSVVKQIINKQTLDIVSRHKRDQFSIYKQNLKFFERICKTKPCVNLSSYESPPKCRQINSIQNQGFSLLYETSRLNEKKKKIIKLRLGNSKKYFKKIIQIDNQQILQVLKDKQAVYIIQFCFEKSKARTQNLQLNSTEIAQIHLKIPKKNFQSSSISAKVIKILDSLPDKEIVKGIFSMIQESNQQSQKGKNIKMKLLLNSNKMPRFEMASKTESIKCNSFTHGQLNCKTSYVR